MRKLFIDYETYYTQLYSLRRMTTCEYLHDPLYETIGAAVAIDTGPSKWLWGDQLGELFARLDPAQTIMVSHNIKFDGAISAWKYGFVPQLYVDTLGMARALLAHKLNRLSLDHVARHLNLGVKGTALGNFIGMNRAAISGTRSGRSTSTTPSTTTTSAGTFLLCSVRSSRAKSSRCWTASSACSPARS
jgi:hypothetical protein